MFRIARVSATGVPVRSKKTHIPLLITASTILLTSAFAGTAEAACTMGQAVSWQIGNDVCNGTIQSNPTNAALPKADDTSGTKGTGYYQCINNNCQLYPYSKCLPENAVAKPAGCNCWHGMRTLIGDFYLQGTEAEVIAGGLAEIYSIAGYGACKQPAFMTYSVCPATPPTVPPPPASPYPCVLSKGGNFLGSDQCTAVCTGNSYEASVIRTSATVTQFWTHTGGPTSSAPTGNPSGCSGSCSGRSIRASSINYINTLPACAASPPPVTNGCWANTAYSPPGSMSTCASKSGFGVAASCSPVGSQCYIHTAGSGPSFPIYTCNTSCSSPPPSPPPPAPPPVVCNCSSLTNADAGISGEFPNAYDGDAPAGNVTWTFFDATETYLGKTGPACRGSYKTYAYTDESGWNHAAAMRSVVVNCGGGGSPPPPPSTCTTYVRSGTLAAGIIDIFDAETVASSGQPICPFGGSNVSLYGTMTGTARTAGYVCGGVHDAGTKYTVYKYIVDCGGSPPAPPANCTLPWGGTLAHGASVVAYATGSVACGSTCQAQTRTCNDGVLSGTGNVGSCTVAACPTNGSCRSYSGYYTSQPATGSANGCNNGSFAEQSDTSGQWRWYCEGLNGGTTVSCGATKPLNCSATSRSWTVGPNTCNGSIPATTHDSVVTASDASVPTTGSAGYRCVNGGWQIQANPICTFSCTYSPAPELPAEPVGTGTPPNCLAYMSKASVMGCGTPCGSNTRLYELWRNGDSHDKIFWQYEAGPTKCDKDKDNTVCAGVPVYYKTQSDILHLEYCN